jgi:hypothetical protein
MYITCPYQAVPVSDGSSNMTMTAQNFVVVSLQKQQATTINHYHTLMLTFGHLVPKFHFKTATNNSKT